MKADDARKRVAAIEKAMHARRFAKATNLENELVADFVRHIAEASVQFATSKECLAHAVHSRALARAIRETFDFGFERYLTDEEMDDLDALEDDEGDEDETPSGGPINGDDC